MDLYSPEQEREDALFFESQPYCAEREADRETHYLWTAGFTTYCDCFTCEGRREAEYADIDQAAEYDAQLDAMTAEELETHAAELLVIAERQRAWDMASEVDPWSAPISF